MLFWERDKFSDFFVKINEKNSHKKVTKLKFIFPPLTFFEVGLGIGSAEKKVSTIKLGGAF